MNDALADEIISINAIYEAETLVPLPSGTTSTSNTDNGNARLVLLHLPPPKQITLRLAFPPAYPDAPPQVLGIEHVGPTVAKGEGRLVEGIVRDVITSTWQMGEECIFPTLEAVKELLETVIDVPEASPERETEETRARDDHSRELGEPPPWVLSDAVTEKKSVFVARCAPVSSPAEASLYISHLVATDKRVARATHNISAWRIRGVGDAGGSATVYQDCDDDGEAAAGGRLLRLLQLMDVWNVVVVVSRWYGGVLLGPDRFRIIGEVAREAVVRAGFGKEEKGKRSKS
ncbi:UPF0029-domain-containing protein [Patellaria atrata CBS 101060]|uniref:UPF0029-domain-containing protein n=1 Tax=Patellaria atrata CBS 101060 TaxID=1346257 RepID=A0A9P4VV68_9PEZI|nr:UPF0029-domain-containing protein [Patellaria atrata CBS 101060]